jgi:hypothetical protein
MRLSIKQAAAALVMGAMAISSSAGTHSAQGVVIHLNSPNPYATGDLGFVYNSWFSNDYIGCQASATSGDCYAREVGGNFLSCWTTDPALLTVIRSLNGDSHLLFSWNPSDATCKDIRVTTDSTMAPK